MNSPDVPYNIGDILVSLVNVPPLPPCHLPPPPRVIATCAKLLKRKCGCLDEIFSKENYYSRLNIG